ncbi:hypothetical protein I5W16_11895 [Stenotrophomonas maltophilia]|nr:hypothetical protein [Stenotrophomonas maltophilia]
MSGSKGVGRLNSRIDKELLDLAKAEAQRRRLTVRSIVEAALRERYSSDVEKQAEWELLTELRTLRRQVDQLDFGCRVLTEIVTLTIPNLFARLGTPTTVSNDAGRGFYNALIASVEKVFSQGTPLLDTLSAKLFRLEPDSSAVAGQHEDMGSGANGPEI